MMSNLCEKHSFVGINNLIVCVARRFKTESRILDYEASQNIFNKFGNNLEQLFMLK